ncbi:MAG: hypothetical protein WA294_10255 [Acidobacteriaceae bacterium]
MPVERYFPACFNRCVRRNATKAEVAGLIDRFLENRLAYPQEWNDFVACSQKDPDVELYRKRCDKLDPVVNRPDPVDRDALGELRLMVQELIPTTRTQHPSQ